MLEILLVEDNSGDIQLFRTLVKGPCHISVAATGAEAFDRLFQRGKFTTAAKPNLIVLDINVPVLNGYELLSIVKGNSRLRTIPVVIWTGSDKLEDVAKAYESGACAFMHKKSCLDEMESALAAFTGFWLEQVTYSSVPELPKVIAERA